MENTSENQAENPSENRRQTMRSVVAKLLNLAMHEKTGKHEAETAMARATEIMAKYNIARHEAILKSNIRMEDTMTEENMEMFYAFRSQSWEAYLAKGIACSFDCDMILKRASRGFGNQENDMVCFLGNDDDVANCCYFFDYLQMLVGGESRKRYKKISDRNDFGTGASRRIGERLKELNRRQAEMLPTDCTALVLVKKGSVTEYVKKKHPRVGSVYGKRAQNGEVVAQGKAFGNTVGLSKGVGSPSIKNSAQITM